MLICTRQRAETLFISVAGAAAAVERWPFGSFHLVSQFHHYAQHHCRTSCTGDKRLILGVCPPVRMLRRGLRYICFFLLWKEIKRMWYGCFGQSSGAVCFTLVSFHDMEKMHLHSQVSLLNSSNCHFTSLFIDTQMINTPASFPTRPMCKYPDL